MTFNKATDVAATGYKRCKLPNGLDIVYQSKAEVPYIYDDIFEKQVYLKHGITLADGDCIFDVGANIGLFTLFAHQRCRGARIYSFEPAPPLFEILRLNTAQHGVTAKIFNCGLSDETKTAALTFYPNSSGMSSFYGDVDEEKEVLKLLIQNQQKQGGGELDQLMNYVNELLDERFKSDSFQCRLTTLSDVMADENIGQIDLLKVDVQKSELAVLRGIKDDDWRRVKQIVLEVHDMDGRLQEIKSLLESHGFEIAWEQDELYSGTVMYNLYAINHELISRSLSRQPSQGQENRFSIEQINRRAKRHGEALNRQKQMSRQRRGDE